MSPLRAYRCEAGHEFEVMESMDGPKQTRCPHELHEVCEEGNVWVNETCGKPVEPVIQLTGRPNIKGGTPIHHKGGG